MEKFLNKLEMQVHEIEQMNVNNNDINPSQPGAYKSDRASSVDHNVDELHSELLTLNAGIKTILGRIGYQLPSMMDQEMNNDRIQQSTEYCKYINEVISKYQDELTKELLGHDDEMDIKELEEKRRKLQEQTKRSSRKVSKTYIAMQKGGGKQKYIPSRSRAGSHRRGNKSQDFLSDDTSQMSGVSEAEKELEVNKNIFVFLKLIQSTFTPSNPLFLFLLFFSCMYQ